MTAKVNSDFGLSPFLSIIHRRCVKGTQLSVLLLTAFLPFVATADLIIPAMWIQAPLAAAEFVPDPDINTDTRVDFTDFSILAHHWQDTPCSEPNWCGNADINHSGAVDLDDFLIMAENWLDFGPEGMVLVYINDPGVAGHEGFAGYMSKYETTNAQYCEFLNAAMAEGLLTVYNNRVYAADDTTHSQLYLTLYAARPYSQITYSAGIFSVRSRNGYSMATHPVVMVSWYGATAFCDYYSFRLPTEWQWQAVADYDGTYTYGCGTTIDTTKANYNNINPLGLSADPFTTPVDYYPPYGYGLCDLAGNALEWTSTQAGSFYILRGGHWYEEDYACAVTYWINALPDFSASHIGFRVCR
jgi:hypothetical protein